LQKIKPEKILSEQPFIDETSLVLDSSLSEYVEIGPYNNIVETIIGRFSYTSENCQIIYSEIKNFVNIASYVRLNPGQHPYQRVCQHHMLYRRKMYGFGQDDKDFFNWRRSSRVVIGNDVWIGHNVTIMGGVNVGDGAVIGSGSIVTKDIPPYAVAVGNPAKVIKFRFNERIISNLQKIAWWNWDYSKIKEHINDFNEVESFIEKFGSDE